MNKFCALVLGATVLLAGSPSFVLAQSGQQRTSIGDAEKATADQIANFKKDPSSLLKTNPLGGLMLTALVKALVLADPSLADAVIQATQQGTNIQAAAIGAGVGQAVAEANTLDDSGTNKDLKVTFTTVATTVAGLKADPGSVLEAFLTGYNTGTGLPVTTAVNAPAGIAGGPVGGSPTVVSATATTTTGSNTQTTGATSTPSSNSSQTVSSSFATVQGPTTGTTTTAVSPF
ncbi:hypothetical protein [Telmatospirillum sp.]|uniref:hypothetical protein n=1 Tax=Telmatospirillum sp. TaxID=2079197 RepID=UPI002841BF7F|nr:hypothetical protein [Telmatospirillum sp.]MDR3435450.1 hypothetical protein [Telmatospirillum sp.]